MSFNIGETVGAYRITEQLGQGGMATVYKAYHASLDRYVAIKALHAAFKGDPNFLARFQREARVVARLEHPNIVPVYDFAEHEGSPYLVMKFIEGETLKAALARGPLRLDEVLKIMEAVGAGLQFAHEQGVLHRDIKPSNVMLAKDGTIYLADFGLARIALAGESTLSSDSMLGTPQYMSPEQAKGVKDLDAGADIYSLGVVLYELVVGRVPFSADTPFAVIHDHIYAPLPMPRTINPNVPEAAERVLFKAMAKERADRYANVTEMVAAFREAVLPLLSGVAPGEAVATALPGPVPIGPAAPTLPASQTAQTIAAAPAPTPALAPARSSGYHFQWWHPFAALALVGCLTLGALVVTNNRMRNAGLAGLPPTAAAPIASQAAAAITQAPAAGIEALFSGARAAFENGQPDQGLNLLDQAVHLMPEDSGALLRAGTLALEFGRTVDALRRYLLPAHDLAAKRGEPTLPLVNDRIALTLYVFAGDPGANGDLVKLTATFDPRAVPALALARWLVLHGELDTARTRLAEIRAAAPDYTATALIEGDRALAQKQMVEARRAYQLVADAQPGKAPSWVIREAQCRLDQLRRDGAAAQLGVTCEPLSSLVTGK